MIYSCAGPAYPRWVTDWPPLAAALLRAAETSGALLVTTGNLYGYGAVDGPMTEDLPLRPNTEKGQVRVRIWNEALEAHRAGRIRTAEVRSSDYLGAGAVTPMTLLVLPKVLAGKRASAPADLDAPHSWTYTGDVARTLLAVAADAGSWGRAWHVPTGPPTSFRQLATRAAELAGVPAPRLSAMPYPVLWLGGLFNPMAYEKVRPQNALQEYLELVIREQLAAWLQKFPEEFFVDLYKLKGWVWPGMKKNRYSVVGHYINDLVYKRLGPGVLDELIRKSPKNEHGYRQNELHQWLTEDIGNPARPAPILADYDAAYCSANGWGPSQTFRLYGRSGDTREK